MSVQFIEAEGRRLFAVLPIDEYDRLREAAEMLDDIRAYDEAKARQGERFPASVADRLIAGESPLRVFREYRGLSPEALAARAGIGEGRLAQIESGHVKPSLTVWRRLADALALAVDDLR